VLELCSGGKSGLLSALKGKVSKEKVIIL